MDAPTIRIDGDVDAAAIRETVSGAVADRVAALLPERRWFGDKDRPIVSVSAAEAVLDAFGPVSFAWVALDVQFLDGGRAGYALPVAVAEAGTTEGPLLALLETSERPLEVLEATDHPAFPDWLLDALADGRTIEGLDGRLAFRPFTALPGHLDAARRGPAKVGGVEQSNTAIRYGDGALVKLFRRLVPGVNLDETVTRFLAERAGFAHVPPPLGSVVHVPGDDGDPTPVALAQGFVPNLGDGWGWVLSRLAEGTPAARDETTAALALLGQRTAEMHRALASDPADPFFAPEPVFPEAVASATAASRTALDASLAALRQAPSAAAAAPLIDQVLASADALAAALSGFGAEIGTFRIRVHGDYHLGQVLRTPEGDWTILDFEGEPARPLAERLEKSSSLKDVAGMLRSLGYARGAAALAGGDPESLAVWETSARAAFLDGYAAVMDGAATPLVPAEPAAFGAALAAWELDKAAYEIRYELANRPDWLAIPLAALVRIS